MKRVYLSMGGFQPYNDFVAEKLNAKKVDTRFLNLPFHLRYFKFLNLFACFAKIKPAKEYVCESFWDFLFACSHKILYGSKIILLWDFPFGVEYEGMPFPKRVASWVQRRLAFMVDHAIVISRMVASDVKRLAPNTKITLVYPFVKPEAFKHRLRGEAWLRGTPAQFIDVSRDTEEKGLRNLKRMFNETHQNLTILDPFCLIPRREGRVFTHGRVPDLFGYWSQFAFFAHYPEYEAFGITILETMALGVIPIIGGRCGASEVLKDHGFGFLVAKNKRDFKEKLSWASRLSMASRRKIALRLRHVAKKFTKHRASEILKRCEK